MSKARNIADLGTNDVLETTSQGIDVTGAVTADGLTVDGDATLQSGAPTLTFIDTDGPYQSGIVQSGTHLFISNQSTGALRLRTNTNVERLQIASSGDISFYEDTGTTAKFFWDASAESLGIGTSSPRAQIDFAVPTLSSTLSRTNSDYQVMLEAPSGTGNYAHNIAWSESTGAAVAVAAINAVDEGSSSATGITFATGNSSSIAERMRIDSSGNVGIGTSSPALYASYRNLVLQGGSGGLYTSKDSTAAYDAAFGVDTSAGFVKCYAVSNHSLGFGTNNTERMRIDSSGNVGIGTSSPAGKLTIYNNVAGDPPVQYLIGDNLIGDIRFARQDSISSYPNSYAMIRGIYGSGDMRRTILTFWTSDAGDTTERMRIDSSGNVGIGTSSPTQALHVNGTIKTVDGIQYASSTLVDSWSTSRKSIDSGTDLDDLRDSNAVYGFYTWGGSVPTNAPAAYLVMLAMNDANQGLQIAWGNTAPAVYVRRANSGVWTSWTQI